MQYDEYYQTENLFGDPYPQLIKFFIDYPIKGQVLDLGCGQGRNAIALARIGYSVTGIDNSKVGIKQMKNVVKTENLDLNGKVDDIYTFDKYKIYDIILLDSMFHFGKKQKEKELHLIRKILTKVKLGALIVFCLQDTGKKVQILKEELINLYPVADLKFNYLFKDEKNGHQSKTNYRMIAVKKSSCKNFNRISKQ